MIFLCIIKKLSRCFVSCLLIAFLVCVFLLRIKFVSRGEVKVGEGRLVDSLACLNPCTCAAQRPSPQPQKNRARRSLTAVWSREGGEWRGTLVET